MKKESKQIRAAMKKGISYAEDSVEAVILKVNDLMAEEAALRKEMKSAQSTMKAETRDAIENLSDDQANLLLEAKWIAPLMENLRRLPQTLISTLTEKVKALTGSEDGGMTPDSSPDEPKGCSLMGWTKSFLC